MDVIVCSSPNQSQFAVVNVANPSAPAAKLVNTSFGGGCMLDVDDNIVAAGDPNGPQAALYDIANVRRLATPSAATGHPISYCSWFGMLIGSENAMLGTTMAVVELLQKEPAWRVESGASRGLAGAAQLSHRDPARTLDPEHSRMNSLASYVAVIDNDLGEAWNEKLTGGLGCG
jgi:hypothetical protein